MRDGLISRPVYTSAPPRVEHSLSPRGEGLAVVANALADRARANHSDIVRGREEFDAGRSSTIPRSPRSRRDPSRHTGDPLVTSVPENLMIPCLVSALPAAKTDDAARKMMSLVSPRPKDMQCLPE
ncbi:winged helix-turn-helix transcriptional regulator [Nocardia rhamnosiphila]|uniref:Winged helix-turn-helix transcriptional regulator n=1 Tax=Nocardia rhamnosiphila TaxID=426716 RepID=A0ABV2X274_9NOCA